MSTYSSDIALEVDGEDSFQVIPGVDQVFSKALQPCEGSGL
jgi:hypothetical protein